MTKTKKATKAIIVELMTEWCITGGLACDMNDYYSYSENDSEFIFSNKEGVFNIQVTPKMVFSFLSELEKKVNFDYVSFDTDICSIKTNGIWVNVHYMYSR